MLVLENGDSRVAKHSFNYINFCETISLLLQRLAGYGCSWFVSNTANNVKDFFRK